MENKEIIRLFKGLATEQSNLRYEMEGYKHRVTKLERQMQKILSGG